MILLALDTSSATGSVAVGRDGVVLAEGSVPDRREQAATLVRIVDETLAAAGLRAVDLDAVAVGEGPGSFTGVRVAAATAKGLAHALGVPLFAVPSTASAALAGLEGSGSAGGGAAADATPPVRYVLFDARADRVYGACYRVDPATGRLDALVAPHGGSLGEVLDRELPEGVVFVGDAAVRHREVIVVSGGRVAGPPHGVPTASALVAYLRAHPDTAPVAATGTWEPRYVRASNAEREWNG